MLHWTLAKNAEGFRLATNITEGKQFIWGFKRIPSSSLNKLVVTVVLQKSLWRSLFSNCLTILHLILAKKLIGLDF